MASMLPPTKIKPSQALMSAIRRDPHGDTVLAQISPIEALRLRMQGGAGTMNPRTGLPQFYVNSGGANGSMQGGVGGNSTAGSHGGNTGGGTHGSSGPPAGTPTNGGLIATGKLTPWGAPIRTNALGVETSLPENSTPGTSAQSWGSWQNQVGDYNKAAQEYNKRTFMDRALNFVAPLGLTSVPPDLNRPATYTGGTFHTGINPAAAVGGLAGLAAPIPGAGTLLGLGAGAAYSAAGGNDAVLTGPDVPKNWDPRGAAPYSPGQPSGNATPVSIAGGNPTQGGAGALLPSIAGNGGMGGPSPAGVIPQGDSALPPVTPPGLRPNANAGGYQPVPGPTQYGWLLPSWTY